MGFVDGPKRNGRYLKKSSKILKGVQLSSFSFEEICEQKSQSLDNPDATIIHARYHSAEELASTIRPPAMLTNQLVGESRSILFPRDFTNDWTRERDRQKRRTVRLGDDDDEIDLEEEAIQAAEAQKKAAALKAEKTALKTPLTDLGPKAATPTTPPAPSSAAPMTQTLAATGSGPLPEVLPTPEQENQRHFSEQKKTIDQVSRVINDLNTGVALEEPMFEHPVSDLTPEDDSSTFQPLTPQAGQIENLSEREIALAPKSMRAPSISAEELESLRDQARQVGYSDGFRLGEEKASLQTRQVAGQLFSHVQQLLQNLVGLKEQILSNVQDNFVEVLQAMAEALLKREFTINPEALHTVIKKAVKEVVGQNDVKISVHPTTFDALSAIDSSDVVASLAKDESVPPGDFRIDSTLTTVDGNAAELIRTMLNKLDLSLFQAGAAESEGASGEKSKVANADDSKKAS